VCLGGPDLDTLFVTSARFPVAAQQRSSEPLAGGLFTLRVPVQGLVEPTFEPDL
jgi:sugar lactone lactonase YvrE